LLLIVVLVVLRTAWGFTHPGNGPKCHRQTHGNDKPNKQSGAPQRKRWSPRTEIWLRELSSGSRVAKRVL